MMEVVVLETPCLWHLSWRKRVGLQRGHFAVEFPDRLLTRALLGVFYAAFLRIIAFQERSNCLTASIPP